MKAAPLDLPVFVILRPPDASPPRVLIAPMHHSVTLAHPRRSARRFTTCRPGGDVLSETLVHRRIQAIQLGEDLFGGVWSR